MIIFCPQTRAQRLYSPLKVNNNWCHTEFVQVQTLSKTDTLFLYMFIVCLQKMLHILDLEILNHKKGKCFFYYQHKEIIFWLLVKMIFIYCKSMCWLYWRPGWEYSVQGSILHGGFKRVSMGLTDRRKTAKNLVDSRKNWKILTVSRK